MPRARTEWLRWIGLAITLLLGVPLDARAASSTSTAALKKFEEGKRAFDRGRFEEALLAFQASVELQPSPNSRLYIGRCYKAIGRLASAYTELRLASREAQDRLVATGERRYTATRDTALREAAEIEAKVPYLTLVVSADAPDDLVIVVDQVEVPRAAWGTQVELDAGDHELTAEAPRLLPFTRRFTLTAGQKLRLDVRPERKPTAEVRLSFKIRPAGITADLDGKPISPERLDKPLYLDPGARVLRVRAPGYATWEWKKTVRDGQSFEPFVQLHAAGGTPRWAFYAVTGAAVGVLALGLGFGVNAKQLSNAETEKDPLLRDPAAQDDIRTRAIIADSSFLVGGALGVTAVVLAFTTRWRETPAATSQKRVSSRSPLLSPLALGLSARWELP